MHRCFLLLLLATQFASASTLYQIVFDGTFRPGSFAFTFDTAGRGIRRDLEGFQVRGRINIDTSKLPTPTTTTLSPSITEVGFETLSDSPRWLVDAIFAVDNLPPFPNAIEFSTGPYLLEPVPAPPNGTNVETPQFAQRFAVTESLDFFRIALETKHQWSDPIHLSFLRDVLLAMNIQKPAGLPFDPDTGQFSSFQGVPIFSSGLVRFQTARVLRDGTQGVFGFVENTFVSGSFSVANVSGAVVVPEPGFTSIAGLALTGLIWLRRSRSRSRQAISSRER
jgi:hypothetical protein